MRRERGQTIAVVLLADDPNVEADLSLYRSTFGLSACKTSNRCFKKVNQRSIRAPAARSDLGGRGRHRETVWPHDTSGCGLAPKPSWQTDSRCAKRAIADVAASASIRHGVSIYGTYGGPGWNVAGGTGVSASIIGGIYGLAENAYRLVYARGLYLARSHLNDVTSGHNGSCGGTYLCTGAIGYDGPTGNGTPNGLHGF